MLENIHRFRYRYEDNPQDKHIPPPRRIRGINNILFMSLEEQRFSFLYKITNCYRQILTLTCESLSNILIEYLADIMIKYENWLRYEFPTRGFNTIRD